MIPGLRTGPGLRPRAVRRAGTAFLLALAAAHVWSTAAPAQGTPQIDSTKLEPYAIPKSPAFVFLKATPGVISRPSTARGLAVSLLQDATGVEAVPDGLAIDVAPWSFVPGLRIPLARYQENPVAYAIANTQVSLGTMRAESDTADTDLGLGARITLFDRGDPLTDHTYTDTIEARIQRKCVPAQPFAGTVQEAEEESVRCAGEITEEYRRQWLKENWNRESLAVAFAGGWRFDDSRVEDREALGWAAWITGSLPLGSGGQLLGLLRYDGREDADDGLSYGARGYLGSPSTNVFVELTRDEAAEGGRRTNWAGGLEFRIFESMWLSTGIGTQPSREGEGRTVAVIADLRWDLLQQPRFSFRP